MLRLLLLVIFLGLALGHAPAQATNSAPALVPAPASTAPPVTASKPLATAILDFQSSDPATNPQSCELAEVLEADMSASPHATLVERADVERLLNEQELGVSGLVNADSAAKIGSLTGAQVLVTGRLFGVGDQYMIVAKIISTETSRVYGVTTTLADLSKLPQAAQDLANKIDGVLGSHRDVLVVEDETPDQRLQRLKQSLGSRPLPSVSIAITERDYSQPSIDPAAQTEIAHDLLQLGFRVFAPGTDQKRADIQISGEAFSEIGVHHGNLVSSRGRVEITLRRRDETKILWTDRETRVGIDIGDRSAGKQAIEKAAGILVERMLPKLTD
jgi:hypothetical protein